MKLRLSVSRKAGAPSYGSDGAAAEVEVEIPDTAAAIAANAPSWFLALEQAVGAELARMQAAHPQAAPQSPTRSAEREDRRPAEPPAAQPRSERRWDPDDLPPARPMRETGGDDEPPREQDRPPNGYDNRRGQKG